MKLQSIIRSFCFLAFVTFRDFVKGWFMHVLHCSIVGCICLGTPLMYMACVIPGPDSKLKVCHVCGMAGLCTLHTAALHTEHELLWLQVAHSIPHR